MLLAALPFAWQLREPPCPCAADRPGLFLVDPEYVHTPQKKEHEAQESKTGRQHIPETGATESNIPRGRFTEISFQKVLHGSPELYSTDPSTQASGALKTGLRPLTGASSLEEDFNSNLAAFLGACWTGQPCADRIDAQSTRAELFNSSPDLMISWLGMLRAGLSLQAPDLSDGLCGMAMVAGIRGRKPP